MLPIGIGVAGALILGPIGDTKVNNRGVWEILSGQYRRIGWLQTDIFVLYDNVGDARSKLGMKHTYFMLICLGFLTYRSLG